MRTRGNIAALTSIVPTKRNNPFTSIMSVVTCDSAVNTWFPNELSLSLYNYISNFRVQVLFVLRLSAIKWLSLADEDVLLPPGTSNSNQTLIVSTNEDEQDTHKVSHSAPPSRNNALGLCCFNVGSTVSFCACYSKTCHQAFLSIQIVTVIDLCICKLMHIFK